MIRLFVRLSPHGVHNPASGSARGRRLRARRGRPRAWAECVGARAWARRRGLAGAGSSRHATYRDMGAFPAAQLEKVCVSTQERLSEERGTRPRRPSLKSSPRESATRPTRRRPTQRPSCKRGHRESATPAPDATTHGAGATSRARREGRRGGSPPGRSSRRRGSARGPCPLRDPA